MHIAILMTNTDESAFAQMHPKDGDKFRALLAPLRPDWKFTVYSVKDAEFPTDIATFDGYIITGSPASVHDTDAWVGRLLGLIRRIVAQGIPVFGACFGHQAIAKALGGRVGDNPGGWVLGRVETDMAGTTLALYAAHREQVLALPDGAKALGGNAECAIGSFAIGDRVLTTQYHPEMTAGFVAALVEHLEGRLPQGVISRAEVSLGKPADTDAIARRIVDFFEASVP